MGGRADRPPGRARPCAALRPPVAPGYVQPPAPTPPVQPTPSGHRVVVSLDAQRIGWLATPSGHNREDYVYHRDVSHTGDLLDTSGRAVGKICDVKPHKLSPGGGLLLSGPLTFGKYVSDDGVESLATSAFPPWRSPTSPSRWRFASSSTVRCRRSRACSTWGLGGTTTSASGTTAGGSCSRRALRREGAAGAIAGRSARSSSATPDASSPSSPSWATMGL